ncbi:M56 family metallopeptidase [Cellvibrio mixtus]|uniref:M56 family metallopeptidase n=1 Tax=Cellvibrio mixtus TaxID=39650 RepID=UPI0005871C5F|nr:M56 family metallopeptidase [Cellvibrio mixtus]
MEMLTTGLTTFTGWLLIASFKSSPLIIALLLAQYGLKKYLSASARHSLWLSVFICLSIPFGWEISLGKHTDNLFADPSHTLISMPSSTQVSIVENAPVTDIQTNSGSTTGQPTTAADHPISLHLLLSYIWAGMFFCLSALTLWQVQRFNRIKKNTVPANDLQEQRLQISKNKLRVNKKIPLLYSHHIQSPLTFGLFKPVIILPIDIEQQLTQSQLSYVLLHELGHIQRRDILWNWLAYWVTLLHWFNPIVWYASKCMKADMEIACDAKVLAHLSQQDRNDYGLTLINVSQLSSKAPRLSHSLGILENHRELKNRLIMIKEFTTMTMKKSFVFGLVFSAFAVASLAQPDTKQDEIKNISASNNNSRMILAEFAKRAEKDLKIPVLVGNALSDLNIRVSITETPLDYGQLLSQLKINEFTAYKSNGYIQIIAVRDARWLAIPTVEKGKKYFDDEYVTDSIKLDKTCAGSILATLRPLVPQYGHLTAMESANMLIISDFYSNTVRVKAMIKMLEENTPQKVECRTANTATAGGPSREKK